MNLTDEERDFSKIGQYASAEVLVQITISNVLSDEEAKQEGFADFSDAIEWLIKEEGNFIGLMDDDWEIISIKEVTYDNVELSSD